MEMIHTNCKLLNIDISEESLKENIAKFKETVTRGPLKGGCKFDITEKQLFGDAVWQGYLDACRTFHGINGKTSETMEEFMG